MPWDERSNLLALLAPSSWAKDAFSDGSGKKLVLRLCCQVPKGLMELVRELLDGGHVHVKRPQEVFDGHSEVITPGVYWKEM